MNMKKVYRKIAKERGITISEVKREMQTAIDYAYHQANNTQEKLPAQGDAPTLEAFIRDVVQQIKTNRNA